MGEGVAQTEEKHHPLPRKGTATSNYGMRIIGVGVGHVKVPSTGGLQILGVGKAVGRKRGGGGYGFQNDVADCAK
jgi:hypothetical protein